MKWASTGFYPTKLRNMPSQQRRSLIEAINYGRKFRLVTLLRKAKKLMRILDADVIARRKILLTKFFQNPNYNKNMSRSELVNAVRGITSDGSRSFRKLIETSMEDHNYKKLKYQLQKDVIRPIEKIISEKLYLPYIATIFQNSYEVPAGRRTRYSEDGEKEFINNLNKLKSLYRQISRSSRPVVQYY